MSQWIVEPAFSVMPRKHVPAKGGGWALACLAGGSDAARRGARAGGAAIAAGAGADRARAGAACPRRGAGGAGATPC